MDHTHSRKRRNENTYVSCLSLPIINEGYNSLVQTNNQRFETTSLNRSHRPPRAESKASSVPIADAIVISDDDEPQEIARGSAHRQVAGLRSEIPPRTYTSFAVDNLHAKGTLSQRADQYGSVPKMQPWETRNISFGLNTQPPPSVFQETAFIEHFQNDYSVAHNMFARPPDLRPENAYDWDETRIPPRDAYPGYIPLVPHQGHHVQGSQSRIQPAVVPEPEPILSEEQRMLVNLIAHGHNVFYTGSAGTGKSTVLKAFVRRLQHGGRRVHIIAPTGKAALNVNGTTTWMYAGWSPDTQKKPLKRVLEEVHHKTVWQRMMETDTLVIDEISMVENHHFERLNAVMKEARRDGAPFGGVQLVVTGDFCQLPPVTPFKFCIDCGESLKHYPSKKAYVCQNTSRGDTNCRNDGIFKDEDKWAFRSAAWKECGFKHINLTQIHRQSDKAFIDILQDSRLGRILTPKQMDLLKNHESDKRNAVLLSSTRAEVKRINDERFNRLVSTSRTYRCLDHFHPQPQVYPEFNKLGNEGEFDHTLDALKDHRFDPWVHLKKGMLVVLQVNLDIEQGLVNGSQGVIQNFEPYSKEKMPKAAKGIIRNPREPAPPAGPTLGGDYPQYREKMIQQFIDQAEYKFWPVVRFSNGVQRTIYADCTVNTYGTKEPYCLLSRTQIPLIPGWAITIHKSQGMTLDRVVVSLSNCFEPGQAYVALSRARTLKGLTVNSFSKAEIPANPEVVEFLTSNFGSDLGPGY